MARHKDFSPPLVPAAADIFTDRKRPRAALRGLFYRLRARPFTGTPPITVFYGVGGAGKSVLCRKAVEECHARMSDQGGYPLAFAHVDLDNERITPAYPIFDLFAGRLRSALKAAGCALPLFDLYCLAWHASIVGDGSVSREQVHDFLGTQQKTLELVGTWWGPLTNFATSLKGADLLRKAGIAFRTARNSRRYAECFPGLELARLNDADFKTHAHEVLAHDLLDFLAAQAERNGHPRALCITIDGFERIQSQVCAEDAQWALQELCNRIVLHQPQPRCGFVLFGRNRLQWRRLYDQHDDPLEDTWDALLRQHLVDGLSERDARHFLDQAEAWYEARTPDCRSTTILTILRREREAILNAAEEFADQDSVRCFHPYSLDLTLRQIDSHRNHFDASKHLGRGHRELQKRFLRYMDETLRSAMQALALALTFDEALFRVLVEQNIIQGIQIQDFHDLVDPGNSQILPTGTGYCFHRKIQEALLAHLHDQPNGPAKAATVIGILVDHFSAQLTHAARCQGVSAMNEAFTRAADILLVHADAGLLDVAVFRQAFFALDEVVPKGMLTSARLGAWGRAEAVLRGRLSAYDGYALKAREKLACCTVLAGKVGIALELFRTLLIDMQRVLGLDHPDTLSTRNNLAFATSENGDAHAALALFAALLPDQHCVLGSDHPDTLMTRSNIAVSTGETGDVRAALKLFRELLSDQLRVLGADHPDTLMTRANIAYWTGETGAARKAVLLFEVLLPDLRRVLGADHPEELRARNNIAHWTGEAGDAADALSRFTKLLPDQERVLGPDHPETLRTRNNIAHWTGQTDEAGKARELFKTLLSDQRRVIGPDHPETLRTRANIAHWTAQEGNVGAALAKFEALLCDQLRVLGRDHPETLRTRANIAAWSGETGDAGVALSLLKKLLPDQRRVLGDDHPDTLTTRNNIAYFASETGDIPSALALFVALLSDQRRVLGSDHPITRRTRERIASFRQRLNLSML